MTNEVTVLEGGHPERLPQGNTTAPDTRADPSRDRAPGVADGVNRNQSRSKARAEFDAELTANREALLRFLRRRLRDPELASDIAQEACSRMMAYSERTDIGSNKLMLFRIARNLLLERHRQSRRQKLDQHMSLEDSEPIRSNDLPIEVVLDQRKAIELLLKKTILQLPTKCRLAFMLSRFEGLSYPQIAREMGVSVKMVEKHITKALLACRAAVGDRDL